jgi:hypothetical protein
VDAPPHSGRVRRLAEGAAMIRALHDSVGGCAISGSGEVAWSCDRIECVSRRVDAVAW